MRLYGPEQIKKMGIGQLLTYEAALRDLQKQWVMDKIFGAFGKPPPPEPLSQEEIDKIRGVGLPTEIEKLNKTPLTKTQLEHMRQTEIGLRSAQAGEHSGLLNRYKKLLPNQIKARGKNCESVRHIRRVINMLE